MTTVPPPPASHPTAAAADMVTAVGTARSVEALAREAGLEVLGPCTRLSQWPGLLEEAPLLQDFTPAEADTLGEAMLLIRAQPGHKLFIEDQPPQWMLLLLSGTVDVVKRHVGAERGSQQPGDHTRVAVLRPGAHLGEMSLLDGEPIYATCTAITEVQGALITRAGVARLITAHPGVGAKLLVKITQVLAQRLRNTSNQLVKALRQLAELSAGTAGR